VIWAATQALAESKRIRANSLQKELLSLEPAPIDVATVLEGTEMKNAVEIEESLNGQTDTTVKRGQESWTYIYISLGFSLTITGSMISMIPDFFPSNILLFLICIVTLIWLFLFNGWFQNFLIKSKQNCEAKAR